MAARANPVHRMKQLWHRDLVAHPVTHGWVLNLYRAGERYPETVTDYFPVAHAPWPWLADALARHRDDERRHAAMFAGALRRMDQPVRDDLAGDDVFNHVIRRCTPASFRVDPDADPDARRLRLAHFLAHAHHLESRIARSQEHHLEACAAAGRTVAARVLAVVLQDELRHVAYTRDAVAELVPRRVAAEVMATHARAEARADLLFSQLQVKHFLAHHADHAPAHRRLLYRVCAFLQEQSARHVV